MKKICIFISFIFLLIIVSCKKNNNEAYTIVSPSGAPYISTLNLGKDYKVNVTEKPADLPTYFATGDYDIIIAPVNVGAKLYKASKSSYRMLGVITWGNLYLASQKALELDKITNIKAFGESTINQSILEYCLPDKNITYSLQSTENAGEKLLADDSVVLIAEPTLSNVKAKYKNIYSISINSLYKEKTGFDGFPQAGVFVRDGLDNDKIKSDIIKSSENIDKLVSKSVSKGLFDSKEIAINAIKGSNIKFVGASDAKAQLEAIVEIAPSYFGGSKPADEFYL